MPVPTDFAAAELDAIRSDFPILSRVGRGGAAAGGRARLPLDEVLAVLKPWLESDAQQKVGQNIKYDMHVLANHGITLRGVVDDTMLESYVLEAHRTHGMDALARRAFWETMRAEAAEGQGGAWDDEADWSLEKVGQRVNSEKKVRKVRRDVVAQADTWASEGREAQTDE